MSAHAPSPTFSLMQLEERLARREVVSPEGVPLVFAVAPAAERFAALLIDLVLIVLSVLLVAWVSHFAGDDLAQALGLLALFAIWSFWFTLFELRWQGRTPGKRLLGLRVISANGAPLTAGAIFVRNATREVEVVLPTFALLFPEQMLPGEGVVPLACIVWLLLLVTLPLWNRDRLRLGDMIAGTMVVRAPRPRLLDELAAARPATAPEAALRFSPAQLEAYGVRELHVLEDLLRRGTAQPENLATVARAIRTKIGWTPDGDLPRDEVFLRAFYAAQRARLEHKLLLGRAPRDKHDAAGGRAAR
ncbi:MAG: RDD family protein [Planctomycetes bacterium]|nr:RDD family protein [Planctomycetota bacterium]